MFNPNRHHNLTSRHLNAAHREATAAETRDAYDGGWTSVLEHYVPAAKD